MAFGMKQWLTATILGLALVAAWRLPPEPVEPPRRELVTAERMRFNALEAEVRTTQEILFRILWSDSLAARVVAEARDGLTVLVPARNEAVEAQRAKLADKIRSQVDSRSTGDMTFGYVIQEHDHRREDGAHSPQDRTETYVGTLEGTDYCMQVRVVDARVMEQVLGRRIVGTDDFAAPYDDELGPCRFYLAYGFAGRGVQEWLERGAVEFALEGDEPMPVDPDEAGGRRRGIFGVDYITGRGDGTTHVDRCLAGIESACQTYFVELGENYLLTSQQREIVRRSPATGLGSRLGRSSWIRAQSRIVADLEREFGAEAFRAFWTSDEDVDSAFLGAFGVMPGAWVARRIERLQGIEPPGPGVPRSASSASMLTILGLLGIAWWRRKERRAVG